jgi:sugar transferase (PEP-CTERM/EpsH1 system associated)
MAVSDTSSNILLLTHRVPYPPDRGDRIRSYHMLRYLSGRYRVYLGALTDETIADEAMNVLQRLTVDQICAPVGPRMRWFNAACSIARGRTATEGLFASIALRSRVRSWASAVRFDAVIAFCSSMLQFANVPELATTPLIVDLVDVDSQKWIDYAMASHGLKKWLFDLESRRVRRLECSLPGRTAAITLVSDAEAELYRSFCPNAKTFAVSNGVDLDYFRPDFPAPYPRPWQCVFVGVLDYRPNVDGLVWFCEKVWPRILARKANAEFAIVGKNPASKVRQLGKLDGVRLIGSVPDVRPYIAESRVSIAPLQIARGIQNKVLEAMAMGKPVVATPEALEGLHIDNGIHALSVTDIAVWSETICQLLDDDCLCKRLGNSARGYVEQNHSWDRCIHALGQILEQKRRQVIPRRDRAIQSSPLMNVG